MSMLTDIWPFNQFKKEKDYPFSIFQYSEDSYVIDISDSEKVVILINGVPVLTKDDPTDDEEMESIDQDENQAKLITFTPLKDDQYNLDYPDLFDEEDPDDKKE